jgi:hypothetical protein
LLACCCIQNTLWLCNCKSPRTLWLRKVLVQPAAVLQSLVTCKALPAPLARWCGLQVFENNRQPTCNSNNRSQCFETLCVIQVCWNQH